MKVILKELQIKQKDFNNYDAVKRASGVYSSAAQLVSPKANAWVKKPIYREKYTDAELKLFDLQSKRPDIFVKTKIINNNLIKTEAVEIIAKKPYLYRHIYSILRKHYHKNYNNNDFREFTDDLLEYWLEKPNFVTEMNKFYDEDYWSDRPEMSNTLSYQSKQFFNDLVDLFSRLKDFIDKNYDIIIDSLDFYGDGRYNFLDISQENIGYTKDGKLKILDWGKVINYHNWI